MVTDTLASYGSLARYKDIPRMASIGTGTLIGASGEYSDFQEIVRVLRKKETEDWVQHDSVQYDAREYARTLSALMYNKRNKMNPLMNGVLVAGFVDAQPYLGYVDMYGTFVESEFQTTAFASHIAKPIIRSRWTPNMSESEARLLLEDAMRACWYRDARASDKIQLAKVTASGVEFEEPYVVSSTWDTPGFRHYSLNPIYA